MKKINNNETKTPGKQRYSMSVIIWISSIVATVIISVYGALTAYLMENQLKTLNMGALLKQVKIYLIPLTILLAIVAIYTVAFLIKKMRTLTVIPRQHYKKILDVLETVNNENGKLPALKASIDDINNSLKKISDKTKYPGDAFINDELREHLQEVKNTLNRFTSENISDCQKIYENYANSIEDIKRFSQMSIKLKSMIFYLAGKADDFSYDIKKSERDPQNLDYVEKLRKLESTEDDQGKKVYVITSDMSLDLYSNVFSEIVHENISKGISIDESTSEFAYKYLIPRGKKMEVPKDVEKLIWKTPKLKEMYCTQKDEKDELEEWPKLELPDIYRLKYYYKEFLYETKGEEADEYYTKWIKFRSKIFLEIDPELFNIFGPNPERTIYLQKKFRRPQITIALFEKSTNYKPSVDECFKELDMTIINLSENDDAGDKILGDINKIIENFETLWNKYKNKNFKYPILNLLDVPSFLEEKASEIWVLTPDLVLDNTFVPIRNLVKEKFKRGKNLNYKFIMPYFPHSDQDAKKIIIQKHLTAFFNNHLKTHGKMYLSYIDLVNYTLEDKFFFVSAETLSQFKIFGELSLYKDVEREGNDILCLFPPVEHKLARSFNSSIETDDKELACVFDGKKENYNINYTDFVLILNDNIKSDFIRDIKTIKAGKKYTEEGEKITYYQCQYIDNNAYPVGDRDKIEIKLDYSNFNFKVKE